MSMTNYTIQEVVMNYANPYIVTTGARLSAVSALTTAIVMETPDVVNQILQHISGLDFWSGTYTVDGNTYRRAMSTAGGTTTYLASMLSAYDLLRGPFKHLGIKSSLVDMLLSQSKTVANRMLNAYDSRDNIFDGYSWIDRNASSDPPLSGYALLSDAGSMVLEWCHISDLTGNATYCNIAQKQEALLVKPKRPPVAEAFPGLLSSYVQRENLPAYKYDDDVTWGADHAYYTTLLNMFVYDPKKYKAFGNYWKTAATSTLNNLIRPSETQNNLNFLVIFDDIEIKTTEYETSCHAAGNLIYGGTLLSQNNLITLGTKLLRTCHHIWKSMPTGLPPQDYQLSGALLDYREAGDLVPPDNFTFAREMYNKKGFWSMFNGYALQKSTPESYYYAYRATGDEIWRDWAWEAFLAINKTARVPGGFVNVDSDKLDGWKPDETAEWTRQQQPALFGTLKYLYMVQKGDAPWQVKTGNGNKYVYNSEGHPLKVQT
ncbi:glycoside hydrolase [Leptodontidium sp. MPI-SDFR-AT-0119]|nr:glycoside hydrolase [Leptodontidium sp. MPI-SDFR-AT-0119]